MKDHRQKKPPPNLSSGGIPSLQSSSFLEERSESTLGLGLADTCSLGDFHGEFWWVSKCKLINKNEDLFCNGKADFTVYTVFVSTKKSVSSPLGTSLNRGGFSRVERGLTDCVPSSQWQKGQEKIETPNRIWPFCKMSYFHRWANTVLDLCGLLFSLPLNSLSLSLSHSHTKVEPPLRPTH